MSGILPNSKFYVQVFLTKKWKRHSQPADVAEEYADDERQGRRREDVPILRRRVLEDAQASATSRE